MKKYNYGIFSVLLFGLIASSEGKACPGRTRAHKTRCDAYYKCTEVNTKKHVWVPAQCEEGLIYESSLEVCVLPADDWECGQKSTNERHTKSPNRKNQNHNKDADVYVVSNAENEMDENTIYGKYDDDGKVEIIIGTGMDSEEEENEDDVLMDGSGNGSELVELDDLMKAETRETEDVVMLKDDDDKPNQDLDDMEKKEELNEILQTIKTKGELGQGSTNIDPTLTAHLQRLSQLIDGLKDTYQTQDEKHPMHDLRPDQLNAFLAHFNIKNKFDTLDPNAAAQEIPMTTKETSAKQSNQTAGYKAGLNKKLNPETKVVLTSLFPKRYGTQHSADGSSNGGAGYSNSQIVVNRPGGAVVFTLPAEQHFVDHSEYSSDNSPKISENTLKTVLELSKQMIASQNVPKVIPNPAYYAPPIMQPILLTSHMDSPFSSNYYSDRPGQQMESSGYPSVFSSDFNNHNYRYNKRPGKRPQDKPTTVIHNNVIPVHVSSTGSGEKDCYGQNLALYPPYDPQAERPETGNGYEDNSQHSYPTKRPSSMPTTISPAYGNAQRPFDFHPTSPNFNKYFTPSEHLNNQNVNNIFQTTDNYGNILRPNQRPNSYKPSDQGDYGNQDGYDSSFSQSNGNQAYQRPNSQPMYSDNQLQQQQSQYPDRMDEDDSDITYTYGQEKPVSQADGNLQLQYSAGPSSQSVFSSGNNPYLNRPMQSHSHSTSPSNSYSQSSTYSSSSNKNKYHEGAQLVNVGGNFINFDVFQNSILPLMGGNAQAANVEVITCAAGVRQPNSTDCTRYYVCSKKDGKVLSYSCPPYTAFNGESRICDARTYALCNPDSGMLSTYTVSENKRIQMETLKALQEAKRKQALQQQHQHHQAMQAQQLANILQQYTPQSSASSNYNPLTAISSSSVDSGEQNMLQSYMQQAASMASIASTTARPYMPTPTSKKRKYYCKEGDKIADQTSISSYFVCFKNAHGQMKGHKMTCSKGLLFCPKSTMCTLPSKCS